MAYVYPENKLEIIDGSLLPLPALPEDVVLVLERAYSGPTDQVYMVDNLTTARQLFGERSPLINLANRASAAGAKNIALYRIGGRAAEYIDLFGEGTSLRLTTASADAPKNLKIYIGPEPKNHSRQCVIIYNGDRIIYSNVLGAELTSYLVSVQGFDKVKNTLLVGTPTEPVPFDKILENIGAEGAASAAAKRATVEDPDTHLQADSVVLAVADIPGFDPLKSDVSSIKLQDAHNKAVAFKVTANKANLIINPYVDGISEEVKPLDTLSVKFIVKTDPADLAKKGISYVTPKDTMNATWKEYFEEMDKALDTVELVDAKAILVGDLANVPNIAHGSKDDNRLEYLAVSEDESGERVYTWSKDRILYRKQGTIDQTTTDPAEAEVNVVGQPFIVQQFGEVDFVHRLGIMAFSRLQDGEFPNIITGVIGPTSNSVRAINSWVGTSPRYDLSGAIVENGTGLLGHRLMVGDVTYKGGYYATLNGFVDGDILSDSTGFPIDLGKHITVVASQVTSSTLATQITSGAAAYAALVSNLEPGQSTTNRLVPNHALMTTISEDKRKALAATGYVVFLDRPRGLTVYSGDVATRENSDFDYISTSITLAQVTKLINSITEPFLGRGTDVVLITAMKTQLETALANAQREGWFISSYFDIRRTGPNSLAIPFSIETAEELRRISSTIRLVASDFTLDL